MPLLNWIRLNVYGIESDRIISMANNYDCALPSGGVVGVSVEGDTVVLMTALAVVAALLVTQSEVILVG